MDSRKFTEGQRDALAAFKKTKEGAESFGKDVEAQSVKLTDVFGAVKKGLVGAIGALVGGEVMQIVGHINNMDAATGRWAKTIGTNVENLSTWQGMIRQVGGSAQEATSAMATLQGTINNVTAGNGMFDNQFGFLLNKIGGHQGKNADQIMRQLQAYFAGEVGSGRMTSTMAASQMGWIPGMNQSMINLLLSDLKKVEDAARAAGTATKESAAEAIKYQESLNQLSLSAEGLERVITIKLTPSLVTFMDRTKQIITELGQGTFISPDSWLGKLMGKTPGGALGKLMGKTPGGASIIAPAAAATLPPTGGMADARARLAEGLKAQSGGGTVAPAGSSGGRSSAADREAWIRSMAGNLGIDPDTAMRVTRSEGFGAFKSSIPGEQSFGDFQLNMNPGSMGDEFRKKTGLDPRDPANEKAMDQFALERAAKVGWDPNGKGFHGATNSGISNWQGIGARPAAAARSDINNSRSSSSTSSNEVHIGNINVNAPNATDADGIAKEIGPAMKRSAVTSPANSALV